MLKQKKFTANVSATSSHEAWGIFKECSIKYSSSKEYIIEKSDNGYYIVYEIV